MLGLRFKGIPNKSLQLGEADGDSQAIADDLIIKHPEISNSISEHHVTEYIAPGIVKLAHIKYKNTSWVKDLSPCLSTSSPAIPTASFAVAAALISLRAMNF